jgi:hypothetical protein
MSEREQYGELADTLEERADTLADENRQLGERIAGAREDSERLRAESGGTPDWDDPDDDDEDDEEKDKDKDKDDGNEDEDDD